MQAENQVTVTRRSRRALSLSGPISANVRAGCLASQHEQA